MSFIIISGYTRDTAYEEEIKDLESDLKRLDLPHRFYGYDDRGDWTKNTMVKAELVQRALVEFPDNDVIWLDADAVVLKDPVFFKELESKSFDICCYYYDKRKDGKRYKELLSGTFVFRNNDLVRSLVADWVEDNTGVEWDQRILQKYVDGKYKDSLRVLPLPPEYIKIKSVTADARSYSASVIVHKQFSRRWRLGIT